MGYKLIFLLLITVIIISGCTETSQIVNKSSPAAEADEQPDIYLNLSDIGEPTNETTPEPDMTTEPAGPCDGMTCPSSVTICPDGFKSRCTNECEDGICPVCMPSCKGHDPCEDIVCGDSVEECPDGYEASCGNTCEEGECKECEPDCSGHEQCELSCGDCEEENTEACTCDIIVPCDGNSICEEGEYPASQDCPDCNDGEKCTEDLYNITAEECYYDIIVPCCGNGVCENSTSPQENHTSCPADCASPEEPEEPEETQEPQNETNISITSIDPYGEIVFIYNSASGSPVQMANWTVSDAADHVYTFPDFMLDPSSFVLIHTGHGTDNSTDLFWNRGSPVWNNDGDNATLSNELGEPASTYSY